jgi:transcriptional regulator with XRE-family HTH domain
VTDLHSRIRALRKLQRRTLKDVADRCGFTVSLLSKIESGKTLPPVATLSKIAAALGVALGDLLDTEKPATTVMTSAQKATAAATQTDKGYIFHLLAAERAHKLMQPILFTAEKDKVKKGGMSHRGEEFVYVLEGRMSYRVGSVTYTLGPGDSLYFNAEEEHDLQPVTKTVKYLAVFAERPDYKPEKKTS